MNSRHVIKALAFMSLVSLTNIYAHKNPKEMLKSAANKASMTMGGGMEGGAITVMNKTDYSPRVKARFTVHGIISNTKQHPKAMVTKTIEPNKEVTFYANEGVDQYGENTFSMFESKNGRIKRVQPDKLQVGRSKWSGKFMKPYPTRFVVTLKHDPTEKYRVETEEQYNHRIERKRLAKETRVHKND